ncbi:MAG: hypothetical protein ACFFDN_43560 [Candidatus Hodarchaeota archaeon]
MTKNKKSVKRFLRNCVIITLISIVVSNIVDFWLGIMDTLFLMLPLIIFIMSSSYTSEKEDYYVTKNIQKSSAYELGPPSHPKKEKSIYDMLNLLSFVIFMLIVTIISDFIWIFYFISIRYHIIVYLIPSLIDSILIIYILISKKKFKKNLDK